MKLFLLAVLTTLFVTAMPLQAALADPNGFSEAPVCTTLDAVKAQPGFDQIEANGGTVTELEGAQKDAFVSRLSALVGEEPPFSVSSILLVVPNDEDGTAVNVGLFSEGCLKAVLKLPPSIVEGLLSPNAKLPVQGEKVD